MKTFRDIHMDTDQVKAGEDFYAVKIFFGNTGEERLDGRSEPARKNFSGEKCLNGWCGTTDNVAITAHGHWRIDTIIARHGHVYDVLAERIVE